MDTASLSNQDISSQTTVHTYTAARSFLCNARVKLTGLDLSLGVRTMELFIGEALGPRSQRSDSASAVVLHVSNVPVKSGEQVIIKVTGIGGDTAVDVASEIFAIDTLNALDVPRPVGPVAGSPLDDLHRSRARLANKVTETVDTRVLSVKDDDGETELFNLAPSESDGVITLAPQ